MNGGGDGSGAMLSACFLLCGLYFCFVWGGGGWWRGVCWSMSYLVFRLWGSRDGGGGLLVQVIFGVMAVGV